ncbi:MAG: vgr related protein, partial [Alphaproteobacteria bacterium]
QQAEIVRHAFLLRNGAEIAGVADASAYDLLVDFGGATSA